MPSRRPLLAVLCLALAPLAACADAPTAPTAYVQEADGRLWVAVTEPAGLPNVRTWLPLLDAASPARAAVDSLRRAAADARSHADPAAAWRLEEEAAALAAASLPAPPPEHLLLRGAAVLDRWEAEAAARVAEGAGDFPELEGALEAVRGERARMAAALERGDPAAAARALAAASATVREQTPAAVALRAIEGLEARLAAAPDGEEVRRARHLLRGAREGLAVGEHARALRRALYALQIAGRVAAP